MKGLKVTNIILFSMICGLEATILFLYGDCITLLLSGNLAGMLASILVFIPYFLILVFALIVLSIVITITTHKKIDLQVQAGLTKTKFDSFCKALPWLFVAFDIILFFVFLIIANLGNK